MIDGFMWTFNSLLGFSSFESKNSFSSIFSKLTTFNSLLGFSSFESWNRKIVENWFLRYLSIPYWDFLVLNLRLRISMVQRRKSQLSIPYWDFLVLNRRLLKLLSVLRYSTFNSLLGFSSFESFWLLLDFSAPSFSFQFPIGIF